MPGLQQRLQVAHIELSPQTKKELDERFVLIYTGQSAWREIFSVMWWDAMWAMNRTVCLRWRRYRSNLQALFLVHPAAFIQVAVDQKQEYNC